MFKVINVQRKANKRISRKTILYLLNWKHAEQPYTMLPKLQGNPQLYITVYTYKLVQKVQKGFGKNPGDNTYEEL